MTTKIDSVTVHFTVTPAELRNIKREYEGSISDFESDLEDFDDVVEVEFDDDDTFIVKFSYEKDMNTVKERIKEVGMKIIESYVR